VEEPQEQFLLGERVERASAQSCERYSHLISNFFDFN
jgi:hypothetical protein